MWHPQWHGQHGRRPVSQLDRAPMAPAMGRYLAASLLAHGAVIGLWLATPAVKPQQPPQLFQVSLLAPEPLPVRASEPAKAPAREQTHVATPSPHQPLHHVMAPTPTTPSRQVLSSSEPATKSVAPPLPSAHETPAIAASTPPSAPALAAATATPSDTKREPASGPSLDAYAQTLSALLAKQRSYPALAAMRGWEGEVRLVLRIARRGGLIEVQVQHSSGYDVLDRNAMQLVQQAAPLPQPPEGLAGSEFQVSVPIQYRLRKNS